MKKYRVLESKGKFYIQVKKTYTETTGILWWRKTTEVESWKICDRYGYDWYSSNDYGLDTLKEALAAARVLDKPDVIHEI